MTRNDSHPTQTPSFIQTGFTGVTMDLKRSPACAHSNTYLTLPYPLLPLPPQLAANKTFHSTRPQMRVATVWDQVCLLLFASGFIK